MTAVSAFWVCQKFAVLHDRHWTINAKILNACSMLAGLVQTQLQLTAKSQILVSMTVPTALEVLIGTPSVKRIVKALTPPGATPGRQ